MAVENVVGTQMTKLTSTPLQKVDSSHLNGRVLVATDDFVMAASASATSTYHCAQLPREAVLLEAWLYVETGAADPDDMDFGELSPHTAGADAALGTGIDSAAAAGWLDLLNNIGADDYGDELWDLLGYSSRDDAPALINLGISLDAANEATATDCAVRIYYTVG